MNLPKISHSKTSLSILKDMKKPSKDLKRVKN